MKLKVLAGHSLPGLMRDFQWRWDNNGVKTFTHQGSHTGESIRKKSAGKNCTVANKYGAGEQMPGLVTKRKLVTLNEGERAKSLKDTQQEIQEGCLAGCGSHKLGKLVSGCREEGDLRIILIPLPWMASTSRGS